MKMLFAALLAMLLFSSVSYALEIPDMSTLTGIKDAILGLNPLVMIILGVVLVLSASLAKIVGIVLVIIGVLGFLIGII